MALIAGLLCVYVVFKVSARIHHWLEGPTDGQDEKVAAIIGYYSLVCGVIVGTNLDRIQPGVASGSSWEVLAASALISALALNLMWSVRIAYVLYRRRHNGANGV